MTFQNHNVNTVKLENLLTLNLTFGNSMTTTETIYWFRIDY